MNIQRKVLVVAAHPDDEILGCGATIAKHILRGDRVTVLILAQGIFARKEDVGRKDLLEALWNDARAANQVLGVHDLIIRDLPDLKMNAIPMLDIVHMIEEVSRRVQPNIIYTHHHGDVNTDHQAISKAMQAICRPMQGSSINHVYAFEVPSATEWNFRHTGQFCPNVFVDVSRTIEKKVEALERYQSEIRSFPHPRSAEYLRSLAKVRGGQTGFHAAEAFELVYARMHERCNVKEGENICSKKQGPLSQDALYGDRIILRSITKEDATPRYVSWLNDPEVNKHSDYRKRDHTIEDIKAYIDKIQNNPNAELFSIRLKENNEHIGNIKLEPIDRFHERAIIGLMIGEKAQWGKGYATEAVRCLEDYAFGKIKLNKLTAGVYEQNTGSLRLFEKLGYVREARRPKHGRGQAGFVDLIEFGKINPQK